MDLVSDGPIAGLVNENGLILSSRDILQGIYLDDTAVGVSNDKAAEESPQYESAPTNIKSTSLVSTIKKVFTNMNNANIYYNGSNILPNFKVFFGFYWTSSIVTGQEYIRKSFSVGNGDYVYAWDRYKNNDTIFTGISGNLTGLTRIGNRWYFRGNNDQVNSLSNSQWWKDTFAPKNEEEYTVTLIIKQLTDLFAIYDNTNIYEKTYLENMFNRNLSYNWKNLNRTEEISNFANKIWKSWQNYDGAINYIIKVDSTDKTKYFSTGLTEINVTKKYSFALLDSASEPVILENTYINDLLLPRMDTEGKTIGTAIGFFSLAMFSSTKDYAYSNSPSNRHDTAHSVAQFNINSIVNINRLELREVKDTNPSSAVRKYNYTNILAEYRSGEEYQSQ